ncbi:uncharacterized protein F4807DRAFT_136703 [Annulohypoxylon truncatum]|uniref:uncharacterized protein n=1 Tax=Annulohypoxylon truncatum TaxID=327061 RepID=UPI0020079F8C|nr:uncharacterized protein F4807DRAFT_136703 [Annulohypoxylon truncatum]KAI1208880.1 hypothetical protein F4807DRAFT_136703 [Annulohypoxylon truncatum]
MAKRKGKPRPKQKPQDPPPKVVLDWNEYFGPGDLLAWQRLMADLGIPGTFSSKTQCRKVLRSVWVNIIDFLEDVQQGRQTRRFESENALRRYTLENDMIYPRKSIPKGSPLASLLARIVR